MTTNKTTPIKRRRGRPLLVREHPADEPIRWNLHEAGREFGVHREKLERRRRALEIPPGPDGCFSTADIFRMAFSSKEAEEIGLIAARRQQIEIQNKERDAEVALTQMVIALSKSFSAAVCKIIQATAMTDAEKEEACAPMLELAAVDWVDEAKTAARSKRRH